MTGSIDIDHTSFAVHDALAWARRLRREVGATPMAGEALTDFRYLLLYVGTAEAGARLELMEPVGSGFLTRFLARHGVGPHHITFTMPDLRVAVAQAREFGATVVGEDYGDPSWQEAFLMPDDTHRTVIQLSQSDFEYPPPAELVSTTARATDSFPSSPGAVEPLWWTDVWDTPSGRTATLGATRLASADLGYTRELFAGLLGAAVTEVDNGMELSWPSGTIRVRASDRPGIEGMDLQGGPKDGIRIGPALLGNHGPAPTS